MKLDYKRIESINLIEDFEDRVLAAAVMYAEEGFYVIPIRPNEKAIPQKSTGLHYGSASCNKKTVETWFTGKYKGWNIGICCGAEDGIFVLDVDNGKDKNGFDALKEMVKDHGEIKTLKQNTPSGGEHYIFQWFERGRSSTSKIAKGIDTRGGKGANGSHIVAWPSSIDGKTYEWSDGGRVMEAPEWVEELMGTPWDTEPRGTGRGNENVDEEALEQHFSPRDIWKMLQCINQNELEYEDWVKIGQSIHSQHPDDTGLRLWDKWSESGERYKQGECGQRWSGFKSYGPIRIGTLIYFAQAGGYKVQVNVTELEFTGEKSEYDELIQEMNAEWGIAVIGGKIRVIGNKLNSDPDQDVQLMSVEDFKLITMNQRVSVSTMGGQAKPVPKSVIWLGDEQRKEFRGGMHFRPDQPKEYEASTGLVYNMWRGWTSEPEKGDWSKLKTHIMDIICAGNVEYSTWLLDWMADLYQDPANPKGCAVVLHGIEGCGKGTFMEAIGRTIGRHYKHVTQEKHFTGQFNGHLQDALLIFADEVIYGGSKKTAGTLKAMVSEPKLTVERKGLDAYSFKNCARVGIASNEKWFIPAGPESRRWFVLNVLPDKASNTQWFSPIYLEMRSGGIEAMMAELLERKVTSNLSKAPVTASLIDQRERYIESRADTMAMWWFDMMEAGSMEIICYRAEGLQENMWPSLVSKADLYDSYKVWCSTSGIKERLVSKALFYMNVSEYGFNEIRPADPEIVRRNGGKRVRMFEVPTQEQAHLAYNSTTGKEI